MKKVIFKSFDYSDGKQFQNNQLSPLKLLIVYRTTYFTGTKEKKKNKHTKKKNPF